MLKDAEFCVCGKVIDKKKTDSLLAGKLLCSISKSSGLRVLIGGLLWPLTEFACSGKWGLLTNSMTSHLFFISPLKSISPVEVSSSRLLCSSI